MVRRLVLTSGVLALLVQGAAQGPMPDPAPVTVFPTGASLHLMQTASFITFCKTKK
jgi:hypothetical protein